MPALPSRAEILGFIARNEPLEKTLERFPGVTRDHLRALLREAALLMRAEEVGADAGGADLPPQRPLVPAPPPAPADASAAPSVAVGAEAASGPGEGRKLLRVYSDGAARGNPGPAGAGAVLTKADGTVVAKCGKFLGNQTNNVAEYTALLIGIETALRLGAEELELVADSELLVRQLTGQYRVKNAGLKPLHAKALQLLGTISRWTVRHVPREQNALADEMSNRAIDEKL